MQLVPKNERSFLEYTRQQNIKQELYLYLFRIVDSEHALNKIERQSWDARVILFRESVCILNLQLLKNCLRTIDRHVHLLHEVVSANIIQPGSVVAMCVSE